MSDPNPRLERIREAVQRLHKCKATYIESEPVTERDGDQILWDGVVEVFDIKGNRKATRCYAWLYAEGDAIQYVAYLDVPPVDSPASAVRAALGSK